MRMSYHPAMFGGYSHSSSEVIMNVNYHVTLQDHVVKGSCDCLDGSSLWSVTTFACLVVIGVVVVEIYCF